MAVKTDYYRFWNIARQNRTIEKCSKMNKYAQNLAKMRKNAQTCVKMREYPQQKTQILLQ